LALTILRGTKVALETVADGCSRNISQSINQIYFSVAGNNNTQYKSVHLKYDIPLLKEWMVRQADTNTIPNLGL